MHAQDFARRVSTEAGADVEAQARLAWHLVHSRAPSESDVMQSVDFIRAQTEYYRAHPTPLDVVLGAPSKTPAPAELLGLTAFCHALVSSNALLYID